MESNYYEILGVSRTASDEEIRIAYKKLAKKYHPDKHAGNPVYEEHFKKINAAYQTLSNSEKRKRYDLKLAYQAQRNNPVQNQESRRKTPPKYTHVKQSKPKDIEQSKKFKKYTIITVTVLVLFLAGSISFYHYMNKISADKHLTEAKRLEENKKYLLALEEYAAAIHFNKDLYEAYEGRGDMRIKLYKDYNGAVKDYTLALQNNDSSASLYFKRAISSLRIKKYDQGLEDLTEAIKLNPNNDSLYFYRAEVNHFIKQNHEAAIPDYSKAIEIDAKFMDAYIGRALCFQNINRHTNSIEDFTKALELSNKDGSTYYYRAFSKMALKDTASACVDFQEAFSLNFNEAEAAMKSYCRSKKR